MTSHRHPPLRSLRPAARSGFTLVELVLVLAILGVVVGITWPNMQRFLLDQRIKEATETVRAQLSRTRNKSIDSMLVYEFRYEIGGDHFVVVPHESFESPAGPAVDAFGQVATSDSLYRYAGMLPKTVKFAAPTSELTELGIPVVEESVPLAPWQLEGLPTADELTGLSWSSPILFYPNGSAAPGVVRLEDESGNRMEITVRGLTGAVSSARVVEETQL